MAELLGRVASKLADNAVYSVLGRRSRSRVISMVRRFRDMIPSIQTVLEDAEKRPVNDRAVKDWLESIKDVYYDMIDFGEELRIVEMKLQEERKVRFLGLPLSLFNPFGPCVVHDDVVRKIEHIMGEIEVLLRKKDELGLRPSLSMVWEIPLVHEPAMVDSRELEARRIITRLFRANFGVLFISIVGEAGIGKTALAQSVYNSPSVKKHFDLRAWVYVSKEFSALQIAQAFVESVTSVKTDEVELQRLLQRIRQIIGKRRYLLVLDGVQNEDNSKWKQVTEVFDNSSNEDASGCAILITTRDEKVAKAAGSIFTFPLTALTEEECWVIIRDQAFGTSIDGQNAQVIFESVGKHIAKKCKGIPLIAKSLGDILHGRTSIQEWKQVLESNVWELLPEDSGDLMYSLMLSYYFLPSALRQCLLFCSIFPENHDIDVDKLIKLWMAQDFVASDQLEMETEGWRCFKGLLDRSIFQEFKKDDNGDFKCKLEGAMSRFIQSLVQNECHIMPLDHKREPGENRVHEKTRHCTINVAADASLPVSIAHTEKLHTLMILSEYSSIDATTLTKLLSHMRRLRALDLSFCSMKELPLKACELLHLRYLDLSFNRDLKQLPQAICNLFNLQTLNLKGCDDLRKLPKGIGKLTQLRHLEILWTTNLSYLPKGIASLTSLRTLSRFLSSSAVDSRACNLADLENLTYLQGYISIDGLGGETGVFQAEKACLKDKHLCGLELWFSNVESGSSDQYLLEALESPPDLECLGIFSYGGMLFPDWMTALEKLTHLMLSDCSKCEFLPPLGKLPSLETLEIKNMSKVKTVGSEFLGIGLNDAVGGEEGPRSTVAFPKLKKLHFQMLGVWEEWVGMTGEGTDADIMPSLVSLSIVSCTKIGAVSDYIKRKENLDTDFKNSPFLEGKTDEDK